MIRYSRFLLSLLLLTLSLLAAPAFAQSFSARCESQLVTPAVTVTSAPVVYSVDNALPYKTIASMAGPSQRDAHVLGLTRAQFNARISYSGKLIRDTASGVECLLPSIGVTLQYQTLKIFVGSEFPEGTCAYNQILAHELRHVQVFQDQLPDVEAVVADVMAKHFARPFYAPLGQAQSRFKQEIDTVWKPIILAEQRKVEHLQRQVDSPEESRAVVRACNGFVRQVINESRRQQAAANETASE